MGGVNATQSQQFIEDLEDFLQVPQGTVPPLHSYDKNKTYVERKSVSEIAPESIQEESSIQICNPEFLELRTILLRQAQQSSQWIRQYFLDSPHVFVSDKE